jgi:protein-disulfide isomerase
MQNQKTVLIAILLLIIGFVTGAMMYQKIMDEKNQQLAATKKGAPFVRDHAPTFGKNLNKVTIVEFMDPECESCAYFHPVVKKVFDEYKEETRLVYRYLANHGNSKFAVKLLEAARLQNKFNETLDVIFKYQAKWAPHNAPNPELLWKFLPEAGLDMLKLKNDFKTINIDEILTLDRRDSQKIGVRGTPTIFVNGKLLKNLEYKDFLDLVESEIYK